MNVRALILDIYGTVLDVSPPPADAAERWAELWQETLGRAPALSLSEFGTACDAVIVREHAAARQAGIRFPEVYWPDVVCEVVPELGADAPILDDFMFGQASLSHTIRLMPGAAAALRAWQRRGLLLGIASNAQPYTLRELGEALAAAGVPLDLFSPSLTFWSFAHGFSKPDPHVFRLLTARLRGLGISAGEALMVGDRLDNDILPARVQGWQTWQLVAIAGPHAGDWARLAEFVETAGNEAAPADAPPPLVPPAESPPRAAPP
jgi:FMN phosphatase YigB (HAD superfamily)